MRTRRDRSSRRFIVLRRSQVLLILFLCLVGALLFWFGWQVMRPQAMPSSGTRLQTTLSQEQPQISAQAAILIDAQSGRVLYERRASDKLAVASLTKMMSVALAFSLGSLDEQVTINDSVLQVEPVLIGLIPGERLKLGDLVAAALVHSGNDAALMLAEHLAGDEAIYAAWMTAQARILGCRDTVFKNAHGLDQEGHLSTAADQAKIARYALRIPQFAALAASLSYTLPGQRVAWNLNHLLEEMPEADGVKIGYTDLAGRCLAASATRNGVQLIAVVLNDSDWFDDARKLLEYGFSLPVGVTLRAGTELQRVTWNDKQYSLCAADDLRLPLAAGEWFEVNLMCAPSELERYQQSNAEFSGLLSAFGLEAYEVALCVR